VLKPTTRTCPRIIDQPATRRMGLLNLRQQLSFYGAYHNNHVNVLIHTLFVPIILFTALVMVSPLSSSYETTVTVPGLMSTTLVVNFPLIYVTITGLYYIMLEPVAGASFFCVMLMMWLGATNMFVTMGTRACYLALAIHVIGWIAQFLGHGVFEGRKPALLDNLIQSIVLAPLFVWLHILFFVGYRRGLQHDISVEVEKRLKTLKAQ